MKGRHSGSYNYCYYTHCPVGTPFDLGNPHVFDGYRCFIADSAADMKVRDYGCNTDVPFICEIKKKHRFNP